MPSRADHPGVEAITAQVRELIVQSLSVSPDEVRPDASFIDDLGADSLAIVELVMAIEKRFKITIPDEDAEKITTVADAVDYILEHSRE
jgi:acyl carrier protein